MPSSAIEKLKKEILRKDLEIKQLKRLLTKDQLTGLYNRRGFEEELERVVKEVVFTKTHQDDRRGVCLRDLSLLFIDIDDFKKINDEFGHQAGDQVLQQVAAIILNKIRDFDLAGRVGGEELIVALIGAAERNAFAKAEEIRKAVKSRVKIPGALPEKNITVSIGIASIKTNEGVKKLIQKADEAMYLAKKTGKDRTVIFSNAHKKKK